jgi:hypothetical protein
MDYAEAKQIRSKSFGTMLGEHEGGLGSSLKAAISQKTQAKMTGLKETFDPMNIAKFMTGGSNWAPALLGKLTGRKQSSIDYFSGVKRRGKGTAEKLGAISGSGGGDFLGILQSIESLLHTTREEDKLKAEEENNFAEEKALEKARRHKELMEALTGKPYKEKVVPTATKEDVVPGKSFLENLIDIFAGPLLMTLIRAVPFLTFLYGLYEAKKLLDEIEYGDKMAKNEGKIAEKAFREKQTDFSGLKISQDEAKAILEQPESKAKERDIASFGGIERIQAIADGKPDPGGVAPKQKTYEEHRQNVLPATVEPRPVGDSGKIKAKQADWDKRNSKDYNVDGTKKTATPVKSNDNEQVKNQSEESANKQSNVPSVTTSETPAPVTETPKPGVALNQAQKENLDLNVPVSKPDPSTVAVNQSANVSKGGKPRTNIPLVRNNEATIQRMIYNNTRVV